MAKLTAFLVLFPAVRIKRYVVFEKRLFIAIDQRVIILTRQNPSGSRFVGNFQATLFEYLQLFGVGGEIFHITHPLHFLLPFTVSDLPRLINHQTTYKKRPRN